MKKLTTLLFAVLAFTAVSVHADDATIRQALSTLMPGTTIDSIKPAEVKGLYEVVIGANILYVTEDGKFLVQGHLIDVAAKTDITDSKLADVRKAALDKMGEQNMIIFKSDKGKHMITVFTDIDCGYCRKLHSEIDQYLAKGITVRYMFFPRAGKGSDSYQKAISVWCAADRNKALTAAKKGEKIDSKPCDNPIDQHMTLAEAFDVHGTPMIVTEKGNVLPGYVPADKLAQILGTE